MSIVKAEVLWSRRCQASCSYCAMVDGRKNTLSLDDWKKGVDQLKTLDCHFIAFYGAEPLLERFEDLVTLIDYAESIGISTTVITSGLVPNFFEKLRALREGGATSLSMSYDGSSSDPSSQKKTNLALAGLRYFQSLQGKRPVRDVAAIMTITSKNILVLPQVIRDMSTEGIWTFFDFIHPHRGQAGSKCKGAPVDLLFAVDDFDKVRGVLAHCLRLKKEGLRCHTSEQFIQLIKDTHLEVLLRYDWHCADQSSFPAWVTVDCDGLVFPCDDYQERGLKDIPITEIADRFQEFTRFWKRRTKEACGGCCWNTHIDAHFIKEGRLPITSYVHS